MRERDALYLDVRTEAEFRAGHPRGAFNVPILFVDPQSGQPRPNPEFLQVVRAHFPPEQEIYIGCKSGPRSLQATMMLRQAGYARVSNVACGFHGASDPFGRPGAPGWLARGLPADEGDGGPRSWARLRAGDAEGGEATGDGQPPSAGGRPSGAEPGK